jgi:ATP/maltotriose-dependent transcriptional regulator MalT
VSPVSARDRGRRAYARRAWSAAVADLTQADESSPLDPEDLDRLADAAFLTGDDARSNELRARSYVERLALDDRRGAARCALQLAYLLAHRGAQAAALAWHARAQGLVDNARADGELTADDPEPGHLLILPAFGRVMAGDLDGAVELLARAIEIAERCNEPDLLALARVLTGRARILRGEVDDGVACLDEAMLVVTTKAVSEVVAGDVYCTVIEGCQDALDMPRAVEWTSALTRWCDSQPDLVPYTGQCLVHRVQIMRFRGSWAEARQEVRRARERLTRPQVQPAVGAAFYEEAELHRVRGDLAAAERCYVEAGRRGHGCQPGRSLLLLARGDVDGAVAAVRRALVEPDEPRVRLASLSARVEIELAGGNLTEARIAADELVATWRRAPSQLLGAMASQAEGAVAVAAGEPAAALTRLRRAWQGWQDLSAPYDAARTRVLLGLVCRALGDEDGALMELDAARWVFDGLGATGDVRRVDGFIGRAPPPTPHHLTGRELEVLRAVAVGRSNRAIAADLVLSEKTIARHVSNIFRKIGVSSRAAATAYAYDHGLT